ncbi:hypothetical protein BP5796_06702 [Coleophoma crateriformis]|uniref:Uncharacterized protein n=1 Tax=Coleophoma crateriformis TaxID=565419 RepID=A0A3D8RPZ9_9HELO|nr:hypothetical protein BP5796_06702 [Coleophoma crateriformis]
MSAGSSSISKTEVRLENEALRKALARIESALQQSHTNSEQSNEYQSLLEAIKKTALEDDQKPTDESQQTVSLFKGYEQPAPNERLQEVINYLADEDEHRGIDFNERCEQIHEYLQDLAEKKASRHERGVKCYDYDENLHQEAMAMYDTHRLWSAGDQPKSQFPVSFVDLPPKPAQGTAAHNPTTGLIDPADKFTQMWEDYDLDIRTGDNHSTYVRTFNSQLARATAKANDDTLYGLENQAYAAAIADASTIPVTMQQCEEMAGSCVKTKARQRGTQRAALELALNTLCRNFEQDRREDRFRTLELARPWSAPEQQTPISKALCPTERPLELDTFHFTKIMLDWRRSKQWDYSLSRNQEDRLTIFNDLVSPSNFHGPCILPLDREDIDIDTAINQRKVDYLELFKKFEKAAKSDDPSVPLSTEFLKRILLFIGLGAVNDWMGFNENLDDQEDISGEKTARRCMENVTDLVVHDFGQEHISLLEELCKPAHTASWVQYKVRKDWLEYAESFSTVGKRFADFVMDREYDLPRSNEHLLTDFMDSRGFVPDRLGRDGQPMHSQQDITGIEVEDILSFLSSQGSICYGEDRTISRSSDVSWFPEDIYLATQAEVEEAKSVCRPHMVLGQPCDWHRVSDRLDFFYHLAYRFGLEIWRLGEPQNRERNLLREFELKMAEINYGTDADDLYDTQRREVWAKGDDFEQPERPLSLRAIARELDQIAPDLTKEAGVDRTHATLGCQARVIQMQVIEEANNNWDLVFPEKEEVWSFAASRLSRTQSPSYVKPSPKEAAEVQKFIDSDRTTLQYLQDERIRSPTTWCRGKYNQLLTLQEQIVDDEDYLGKAKPKPRQFFSMFRWPVEVQNPAQQLSIISSGPIVDEKPAPTTQPDYDHGHTADARRPREIHVGQGQPPHFPFGETPFQQAWQSFRMEWELRNSEVFPRLMCLQDPILRLLDPDFMPRDPHGNLINSAGHLVDEHMNLINEAGQHVDLHGNRVREPIQAPTTPPSSPAAGSGLRTSPRDPYALPPLPKDWKPRSVDSSVAWRDAVRKIYEDKDLFAAVGPGSVAYDLNVFGPQGDALIAAWKAEDKKKEEKKRRDGDIRRGQKRKAENELGGDSKRGPTGMSVVEVTPEELEAAATNSWTRSMKAVEGNGMRVINGGAVPSIHSLG